MAAGRRETTACAQTGLRLLGGLVRGAPRAASEKAYVARSAGDLCAFLAGPEALNAGVAQTAASWLVCLSTR